MSCGFPSVGFELPFPRLDADLPEPPELPEAPDLDWLRALDLPLPGFDPSGLLDFLALPFPTADIPEVPEPPPLPDFGWRKDLGLPDLDIASFLLMPPFPTVDIPEVPEPPFSLPIFCPFDEAA